MSEYGEGAPPPPPPYGGGSQPPQYGSPQPPQYGQPQQPPPYGQPQYGSPQPQYGQPPQYGAPQQPYGAPQAGPPGYGAPGPYGQPSAPSGYGAPYGAPVGAVGTPASMGKRLGARLLDGLIVGIPLAILYSVLVLPSITSASSSGTTPSLGGVFAFQFLAIVVGIGYEVALIATRGATVGKQLLGIKVVREADGGIPGWGPAGLRWLIPFVGSFLCGIGQILVYLSPFFDATKRNQGWHDKVAKTLVVNR